MFDVFMCSCVDVYIGKCVWMRVRQSPAPCVVAILLLLVPNIDGLDFLFSCAALDT